MAKATFGKDDWGLYPPKNKDEERLHAKAVAALEKAYSEAMAGLEKADGADRVERAMEAAMRPVQKRYERVGANDTVVGELILARALRELGIPKPGLGRQRSAIPEHRGRGVLGEAAGGGMRARTLPEVLLPVYEEWTRSLLDVVRAGLVHRPTVWRYEMEGRMPAAIVEWEATDLSDVAVKGTIVVDLSAYGGGPGTGIKIRLETESPSRGSGSEVLDLDGDYTAAIAAKRVLERLQAMAGVRGG